eukprot:NODE_29_length_33183_cov_0.333666.p1 type:complete len:584 gc:universal NODE_29_length_33183_cov_0.333666:19143-17392(-)
MLEIESNLLNAIENPLEYRLINPSTLYYTNSFHFSHILMLLFDLLSKNCTNAILSNLKSILFRIVRLLPREELVHLAPGLISKMTKLLMKFKDKSIVYPSLEFVIISVINDVDAAKLAEYLQYLPFKLQMNDLLSCVFKRNNEFMIKSIANAFLYNVYNFKVKCDLLLPLLLPKLSQDDIVLLINMHYLQIYKNYDLLLSRCRSSEYVHHIINIIPIDHIYMYISQDSTVLEYLMPYLPHFSKYSNDLKYTSLAVKSCNFIDNPILWDALNADHQVALENISSSLKIPLDLIVFENFDYLVDRAALMIPSKDALNVLSNSLKLMNKIDTGAIAMLMDDSLDICFDVLESLPRMTIIEEIGVLLYRYTLLLKKNTQQMELIEEKKVMPHLEHWLDMRLNRIPKKQETQETLKDEDDSLHVVAIFKIAMQFISYSKINIRAIYMSIIYNCLELFRNHKLYLNCIHLVWEQLLSRLHDDENVVYFVLKIITKIVLYATDFMSSRFKTFYIKIKKPLLYYLNNNNNEKLVNASVECLIAFINYCNLNTRQLRELRQLDDTRLRCEIDKKLPEEAFLHNQEFVRNKGI